MALALCREIIKRVPDLTYSQGIAVSCVHNSTYDYLRQALHALRRWINAKETRRKKYEKIDGDFSVRDAEPEAWCIFVKAAHGQTVLSCTYRFTIELRSAANRFTTVANRHVVLTSRATDSNITMECGPVRQAEIDYTHPSYAYN